MRSVIGYSIFTLGLGLAAQTFFPGSLSAFLATGFSFITASASHQTAERDASVAVDTDVADEDTPVARFAPGRRFVQRNGNAGSVLGQSDAVGIHTKRSTAVAGPAPRNPAPRNVALRPWQSAVAPVSRDMARPLAALRSNPSQRNQLVRKIQSELKRAGCYGGAVDGDWGPGSKRAMAAFIKRVNATLPLSEPDNILLMLVRSQPPGVCLDACPEGKTRSVDNQCVPNAAIARADKPATEIAKPTTESVLASAGAADTGRSWLPGEPAQHRFSPSARMSIGGPKIEIDSADTSPGGASANPHSARVAYSKVDEPDESKVGERDKTKVSERDEEPDTLRQRPPPRQKRIARSERRYSHAGRSRSVQDLFRHPLGM